MKRTPRVAASFVSVCAAVGFGAGAALGIGPDAGAAGNDAAMAEVAQWGSAGTADQSGAAAGVRNVPAFPGITAGCQLLGTTAFATSPAFRRADNFKPLANSTINGVSWSGYYRLVASQANGAAPAGEMFEIRFFNDAAGVPGTLLAGPMTVTPTSTQDGTFGAGGPPLYDYVATLPSGVSVTGGECYWLEIRNLTVAGQRWFWHASPASPGDTISYATGVGDSTYDNFEQVASDLAFCLDIELNNLTSNSCPIVAVPSACANPDANGQPRSGATSGFSSNMPGSLTVTGGSSVAFERAEAFRLTNGGSITNVCFYAFWNSFGAAGGGNVGGGTPALPDLVVTYYNNDHPSGLLPGSVLAQYTVGAAGVTLAYDTTGIHRIDHPPVNVSANTCYYISISYRSDVNDPSRHSRFIWGFSNSAAANTDGLCYTRTTNTNPIGPWGYTSLTAPARGMSFLFNVGDSVLPCTPPVPTNTTCATAASLTLNGPALLGSNIGIALSTMPPCQFDLVFGSLAWYTFVGDGNTVTLQTCNADLAGDPNINVYCAASCAGPFNCIGGNDDLGALCAAGALAAGVAIPTVAGSTYYVTVHGTNNTPTTYRIGATTDGTPVNPPAGDCASFTRCEISGEPQTAGEADVCTTSTATNTNATCATGTVYPSFGTVVGGRVSTYLNGTTNTRDLDYWRLPVVTTPTIVTWRIYSEFPTLYQFLNYGAAGCTATPTVLAGATRVACLNQFVGEVTLPANSTVALLITAPDFQGLPCPNFNDYRMTVSVVPQAACCVAMTDCFVTTQTDCQTQGGTFNQASGTCSPDPCASGACCRGATCSVGAAAACTGLYTRYAGDSTVCNAPGNNTMPCCKADYNQSGSVSVQDIFDFLADYFAGDPRADVNGIGGVTVQDIFDYLAVYFAGCA